jgi:hypothetical protein
MPPKAKDAALVLLVLVNVILLCAVLAYVLQLPQANAQPAQQAPAAPRADRFLAVSGMVESSGVNALFVLDPAQQRLYAWVPQAGTPGASMMLRDIRDLRADFARQPAPAVPPRTR